MRGGVVSARKNLNRVVIRHQDRCGWQRVAERGRREGASLRVRKR